MLERLVEQSKDPFARYGLAMEYAKLERPQDALATFAGLRAEQPDYLPMYLMAGQVLIGLGRGEEAGEWLGAGMEVARRSGDAKTLSELEAALAQARASTHGA
jgi:predicted Zn-dependent protease